MAELKEKAEGASGKTTASKSTETAKEVSGIIKRFYARAREASANGEPVAWCMAIIPQEIMLAMDVVPVYTENYATVCAAKQSSLSFLEKAEGDGFSYFICSYARNGLGYAHRMQELEGIPPEAPWGGLPKPALFIGRGNCEPGYKWYQATARFFNAPIHIFDWKRPPVDADWDDPALKKRYVQYEVSQLKEFIAFLQKHTGHKVDWVKLAEAVKRNHQSRYYWHQVHALRRAVPSPMPTGDMATCIFPGYFMAGTQETLDFYQKLYHEVKDRVDRKIGVIPNEKFRLLWGGIAQWHNLGFYNHLESLGAVFAIETNYYRDAFTDDIDFSNPLEAMALMSWDDRERMGRRARAAAYGDVGDPRAGLVLELVHDYKVDGVIFHMIFSCRPISIGWTHTRNVLRDKLNLPTFLMESDICDTRAFSEAQTESAINAFMETVAASKRTRG